MPRTTFRQDTGQSVTAYALDTPKSGQAPNGRESHPDGSYQAHVNEVVDVFRAVIRAATKDIGLIWASNAMNCRSPNGFLGQPDGRFELW